MKEQAIRLLCLFIYNIIISLICCKQMRSRRRICMYTRIFNLIDVGCAAKVCALNGESGENPELYRNGKRVKSISPNARPMEIKVVWFELN